MPTVRTVSLRGLTGHRVTVTAVVADGPPAITLIGGSGRDERELRDRVRAAVINCGQPCRHRRVEVHLDPPESEPPAAAVAVAVLAATAGLSAQRLAGTAVLGEVGLDGSLRPTSGTLPAVQAARAHGIRRVIVPAAAAGEAALVNEVDVLGAYSLAEIADWLRGGDYALPQSSKPTAPMAENLVPPERTLVAPVMRAVQVAAAGGHHMLFDAVEGAGTRLAARWLHQLLPDLTPAQQIEVAAVRSLTGWREEGAVLVTTPPIVSIHHSASMTSLVGGAVPGAVSRAHHGVLVACDLDQFTGTALDSLRVVLLRQKVRLARGRSPLRYPASLQLFATCAHAGGNRRQRLPQALLDAIDVRLPLATAHSAASHHPNATERKEVSRVLAQSRTQVDAARARATARWSETAAALPGTDYEVTNASVSAEVLHTLPLPAEVTAPMLRAQEAGALSRHGTDTVVRLAWTAADLDGADRPAHSHIEEALALRQASTLRTASGQDVR